MTDPTEALAAMLNAAQQIEAENGNFLRAIARAEKAEAMAAKLAEALREAKSELESYELEMRGETYNSPMINAALAEWESFK